jgi:hypothetical protein
MNTRTLLGISLAAVFAIAMTPAFAGGIASYYDVIDAEVREKTHPNGKDFGLKLEAYTATAIPTDGSDLLGYGVLTDGAWLVATTSHAGVLDSTKQTGGAADPIWHNHYVALTGDGECPVSPVGGLQLSVSDLTWESPGTTKIDGTELKLTTIDTGIPSGTWHSGAGGSEGGVVAVNTGIISDQFVSFHLMGGPSSQICVIVNDIITASD